jgi:hypothetical protein
VDFTTLWSPSQNLDPARRKESQGDEHGSWEMNTGGGDEYSGNEINTGRGDEYGGGWRMKPKEGDKCWKNDKYVRKKMKAKRKRIIRGKEANTGEIDEYS